MFFCMCRAEGSQGVPKVSRTVTNVLLSRRDCAHGASLWSVIVLTVRHGVPFKPSLCSRCVAVLLQAHPPHRHRVAHASSGNPWMHRLAQASRRAHQQALQVSGLLGRKHKQAIAGATCSSQTSLGPRSSCTQSCDETSELCPHPHNALPVLTSDRF